MDPRLRSGIFLLGNGHHFQVFDFHDFLKLGVANSRFFSKLLCLNPVFGEKCVISLFKKLFLSLKINIVFN